MSTTLIIKKYDWPWRLLMRIDQWEESPALLIRIDQWAALTSAILDYDWPWRLLMRIDQWKESPALLIRIDQWAARTSTILDFDWVVAIADENREASEAIVDKQWPELNSGAGRLKMFAYLLTLGE